MLRVKKVSFINIQNFNAVLKKGCKRIRNYTYLTSCIERWSSTHQFWNFTLRVCYSCISIKTITCISCHSDPTPPPWRYNAVTCQEDIPEMTWCNLWLHQHPTSSHSQTEPVVTDLTSHQCFKKETLLSNNLQRRAYCRGGERDKKGNISNGFSNSSP